jgi:hypothetical protein
MMTELQERFFKEVEAAFAWLPEMGQWRGPTKTAETLPWPRAEAIYMAQNVVLELVLDEREKALDCYVAAVVDGQPVEGWGYNFGERLVRHHLTYVLKRLGKEWQTLITRLPGQSLSERLPIQLGNYARILRVLGQRILDDDPSIFEGQLLWQHEFKIVTDHFQFFIHDAEATLPESELWDEGAKARRLAARDNFIAVGTARYSGVTRVRVDVYDTRPATMPEECDYRAEAMMRARSRRVRLSTPESTLPELPDIPVMPMPYHVVVCYVNSDQVADEEQTEGPDWYHVIMWPGPRFD